MSDAAGTLGANPEQEHINSWPVDELEPHSKNVEIYREKSLSRDFVESIKKRGVEVPLLVTKQGIVIDGSRRLRAAREIGLVEVPVVEKAFDSELDEREAVVHLNKNRVKTFLQRMREAEELFRIEKTRAKQRQGVEPGTEFAASEYGRSRDKVANEVEIGSGETLRKAMRIWEARENEGALGQTSRTVLKEINEGDESIHGGYKRFSRKEEKVNSQNKRWWDERRHSVVEKYEQFFDDKEHLISKDDDWRTAFRKFRGEWNDYKEEHKIDGSEPYALLQILLYQLQDEGYIQSEGEWQPDSIIDRKPSKSQLEDLYWEEEMKVSEIGLIFGLHFRLVEFWMREYDIPVREDEVTQME